MKKWLAIFIGVCFLATAGIGKAKKSGEDHFTGALKNGNAKYFQQISSTSFNDSNQDEKSTKIETLISAENYKFFPHIVKALIGAFSNKDKNVRIAVYGELSNAMDWGKEEFVKVKGGKNAIKDLKAHVQKAKERDEDAAEALDRLKQQLNKVK